MATTDPSTAGPALPGDANPPPDRPVTPATAADSAAATAVPLRVVLDYGAAAARMVVCGSGRQRLLRNVDGSAHWPSGVIVDQGGAVRGDPGPVGDAGWSRGRLAGHEIKAQLGKEIAPGAQETRPDPVECLAAVLRSLLGQAQQAEGAPITAVALTIPAGWGPRHRSAVRAAAARAGVPEPELIPCPVAVAWELAGQGYQAVAAGESLLVCDAGYSAFEPTALVRTTNGFAVLATAHLPDAGGHALDAAVTDWCVSLIARSDPTLARQLAEPSSVDQQRVRAVFEAEVQAARRELAAGAEATLALPPPHQPVVLDRAGFEQLVGPIVE